MNTDEKILYFPPLLNRNLPTALIWMFCTKRSLRRINNIHEHRLLYSKTTDLNLKDSRRIQMKNRFTRNALNFF